jgi:hypothetical protein
VAIYLGQPFCWGTAFAPIEVAQWSGSVLLGLFSAAAWGVWKRRKDVEFLARTLPWLTIASFALANAVITMFGRLGYGVSQALASRYSSYALLLPVALLPLGFLFSRSRGALTRSKGRPAFVSGVTALVLGHLLSEIRQMPAWSRHRHVVLSEKAFVQTANLIDTPSLLRGNDSLDVPAIQRAAKTLDELGYLRPGTLKSPSITELGDAVAPGDRRFGQIVGGRQRSTGQLPIMGWAVLPDRTEPAHAVLLTIDDANGVPILIDVVRVGVDRPDVVEASHEPEYLESGWVALLDTQKLPRGAKTIKAWAYDAETRRAFRLEGSIALPD